MNDPAACQIDLSVEAATLHINALEKMINELSIFTRRPDLYPFDTVAGEMIAKAFALARSAVLLIHQGYPDEAFGLCRSIYESAIYLRYISREPDKRDERARSFLEFGEKSKAFWFDLLDKSDGLTEKNREDIKRYKNDNQIPDHPKVMTQPWSREHKFVEKYSKSAHPLDDPASTEDFRDRERAFAYNDTSTYVHCTQAGLNGYFCSWKEPILLPRPSRLGANNAEKACLILRVHLRAVAKYCLFGMNLLSLADLETTSPECRAEMTVYQ